MLALFHPSLFRELEHHSVNAEFERQTDIKYIYKVITITLSVASLSVPDPCKLISTVHVQLTTEMRKSVFLIMNVKQKRKKTEANTSNFSAGLPTYKNKPKHINANFSVIAAIVAGNYRLFNRLKKIQAMLYIN